ncbi:MAG: hypothetical protein KJ630_14760 [Proteobacteria bacterium]|nr:hypothetical protein [Pseudomonadota bacterium]
MTTILPRAAAKATTAAAETGIATAARKAVETARTASGIKVHIAENQAGEQGD